MPPLDLYIEYKIYNISSGGSIYRSGILSIYRAIKIKIFTKLIGRCAGEVIVEVIKEPFQKANN